MEDNDSNSQPVPDSFPLTLDEFCTRLSLKDKRVEMIGAFNAMERHAGHVKDTEVAYQTRYNDFLTQPA